MATINNLNSGRSETFTYDALNRIATAETEGTSGSNCFGFQFTDDAWSNLTATSILSGYTSCSATTPYAFSISVSTNNRITTSGFGYDSSGNLTSDGINSAYVWNAEGEATTAGAVNYLYDGLGNRVEKANGTLYWYGPAGEVLDETDLSGNLKTEYVFFGGKRIAERDSSGNIHYYVEDHLGSSRAMTDANGNLCYDADFLPYGQEVDYTNSCGSNYKFEGKERDTETQNDNFGARYYRSLVGRWLSPDWSAVPAPVPYANVTNPQTLNLYAMVSDNPETFADLDGHLQAVEAINGSTATIDLSTMVVSTPLLLTEIELAELTPPTNENNQPPAVPSSPDQVKAQNKSPDPNLPVNNNYRMVVLNDSGKVVPVSDTREVQYSLHTAPDSKNPIGTPPKTTNIDITEHLSNSYFKGSHEAGGLFQDTIGPHGNHWHATETTERYFTASLDGKQLGVIPILDRSGTHLVDHIEVDFRNDRTRLNGTYNPTDVP